MDRQSSRTIAGVVFIVVLMAACSPSAASQTPSVVPSAAATPSAPVAEVTSAPSLSPEPLTFTPGTATAPRVVEMSVDDLLNFTPGLVQAVLGETVTFRIHNVGKAVHEFMIGPLADAFADKEGTAEVADIAAGTTAELTFTFTGKGPFAFACHAPGHFEHGMAGYIQLVGPGAPTVGTADDPRVVRLDMTDSLKFNPDQVAVAKGEAIRFVLTNSGLTTHEFQVGPADKVAADDVDGVVVVEKDELDAGSTRAVDYTFSGAGPFAFACHMPGHYEAGMKGTIAN
jgi:uncharacterized cupredoxin-like copper-binding protein